LTQAQIGSTVGDTNLVWRCPDNAIMIDSENLGRWATGDFTGLQAEDMMPIIQQLASQIVSSRQMGPNVRLVGGTEWNAMLYLVLNALKEDETSLGSNLREYLEAHLAPPNAYYDVKVSEDVLHLIKYIAPATTLTEMELGYVQDECDIILRGPLPE